MKNLLVICMAVHFIAQASSRPDSQIKETFQDMFDSIKQKMQVVLDYTQEVASHALESAKNMMQDSLEAALETVQRGIQSGQNWTEFGQTSVEKFNGNDEFTR